MINELNLSRENMGKFIDMSGEKFGKLTAIERSGTSDNRAVWLCKCDCGNLKEIIGKSLRSGLTKSCGCVREPDLSGKKFGRWSVINKAKGKYGKRYWLCECECGNKRDVQSTALTNGSSTSCGCFQKEFATDKFFKDYTGYRNGMIEVISFNRKENTKVGTPNQYYWNVKCDCGNTKVMSSSSVRSSRSCGCAIIPAVIASNERRTLPAEELVKRALTQHTSISATTEFS